MAALSWLLIPVTVAVLAALWVGWATRERPVAGDAAGVAGYERFRDAMERSRSDVPVLPTVARVSSEPSARAAD